MSSRKADDASSVTGTAEGGSKKRKRSGGESGDSERSTAKQDNPQKQLKKIGDIYHCPITQQLMVQPVVAADGHHYEKDAIARWFASKRTSPRTNQRMTSAELVECVQTRNVIAEAPPPDGSFTMHFHAL